MHHVMQGCVAGVGDVSVMCCVQLQPQQAAPGSNQKVCLVEALINNGAWLQARRLIDRYPPYSITGYLNVTRAVTRLLHHTIEPLYSQCVMSH
jgi:hypothetical protein